MSRMVSFQKQNSHYMMPGIRTSIPTTNLKPTSTTNETYKEKQ